MSALNIGIIGCGMIAPAYLRGCALFPDAVNVTACADIDEDRATQFAQRHGLRALTVADLMRDDAIDMVLNLTIPVAHAEVNLAAIAAGKHIYSEKPLATTLSDGQAIIHAAEQAGVRVGCAPDTFLGGGGQTVRHLIDTDAIGRPLAATAFMLSRGPEPWHSNPFFYYQPGGGPVMDMGPYYITTLVNLLGPVTQVSAITGRGLTERVAGHESIAGQAIPVDVSTHASGTLLFASGAMATLIMSFDIWKHNLPRMEIYGTDGTISGPDPNTFGGTVRLWQPTHNAWRDVPLTHRDDVQRGIGVADMATAIANNIPHRASGALALHVLEIMLAFDTSSAEEKAITIKSTVEMPAPLPQNLTTA